MGMQMDWPAATGFAGAACTTLAFLPQLFKIKKEGSSELSTAMLAMYVAGQALWLVYGFAIGSVPVIGANAASLLLVSAVAIRKSRTAARGRRPLRIAIDMDEVMADALSEHVRRYNVAFDADLAIADLQGHLEDCVPSAHREATLAMIDGPFFEDLALFPDCQAVIRELAERHEVFIATAAMDVPFSFDAKYRWLQRHFPFIPPSHIVFCGDKSIVDADYLIDDRARHFARFKGRPLLFSAPHNHAETRYPRVASWREIRELFAQMDAGSGVTTDGAERQRSARIAGPSFSSGV